jgi:hypothetical protein
MVPVAPIITGTTFPFVVVVVVVGSIHVFVLLPK